MTDGVDIKISRLKPFKDEHYGRDFAVADMIIEETKTIEKDFYEISQEVIVTVRPLIYEVEPPDAYFNIVIGSENRHGGNDVFISIMIYNDNLDGDMDGQIELLSKTFEIKSIQGLQKLINIAESVITASDQFLKRPKQFAIKILHDYSKNNLFSISYSDVDLVDRLEEGEIDEQD